MEVSLLNASNVFRPRYTGKFENGGFTDNASNAFRPHYAGEISQRNNQRSFWIWVENSGREIT